MFIGSNEKCPVCDKVFTEGDDIVICPKCGTPHHRACYNSIGHCFNEDKHKTGFEYGVSTVTEQEEVPKEAENKEHYYQPSEPVNHKTVCSKCGKEINNDAPFCCYCGERQSNPQYREYSPVSNFGISNAEQQRYEGEDLTIDGKNAADVASVVRTNTARFIPKFIKNKKISWNWSAFIFGPYYLFYRKMYKQGTLFLLINVIIQFFLNGFYSKEISDFMTFFNANYQTLYTNPSSELISEMTELSNAVMPMMYILVGAVLIINTIIALFADSFYKTRVMQVLDRVDENLQQGASFNMVSPMFDEASLSQADMKKLYLGKMGGTSILSPIAAWCALDLLTWLVSQIIS